MKNSDMPAMPGPSSANNGAPHYHTIPFEGLTKREYFAAMAMQGNLAAHREDNVWPTSQQDPYYAMADSAVKHADALLAKLEESE